MNNQSQELNLSYFAAKGTRYHRAFANAPAARIMEVLPFLFLIGDRLPADTRNLVVADLLCGDGYFSAALAPCFQHAHAVDLSPALAPYIPRSGKITPHLQALDSSTRFVADLAPDVIISNAGLHHLYHLENGRVLPDQSDELQLSVLLNWVNSLRPNGVLVVADIPGENGPFTQSTAPLQLTDGALRAQLFTQQAVQASAFGRLSLPWSLPPSNAHAYAAQVQAATHCSAGKTNPATWFREVVAKLSTYGHVDHFSRSSFLVPRLQERGLTVGYYDLPTPLGFKDTESFIRFFNDAFGLSSELSVTEPVPETLTRSIIEHAEKHLGVWSDDAGTVWVGWRSGYYVISSHTV